MTSRHLAQSWHYPRKIIVNSPNCGEFNPTLQTFSLPKLLLFQKEFVTLQTELNSNKTMKKLLLLLFLLLSVAGVQTVMAQQIYNMSVWRNGSYTDYLVSDVDSVTFKWVHGKTVTDITLDKTKTEVGVYEMKMLWAMVLPEDAGNKKVTWESSDETIATVSESGSSGIVVGRKKGTCTITCCAADGGGAIAQCQVTVSDENMYVDLGLPSGTLWAKWNVGAHSLEEYGDYFAWGETKPKSDYRWETYKYCEGTDITLTKYNWDSELGYHPNGSEVGYTDDLSELLPEDDAATANWGEDWQMPSIEQIAELGNGRYTSSEVAMEGGNIGIRIISNSNGNSIFLPAAGTFINTDINEKGRSLAIWTRSLSEGNTQCGYELGVTIVGEDFGGAWGGDYRYYGFSVRPVRKK